MSRRPRRGARLDFGEVTSLIMLALMGLWGIWFGVQSLMTLWWPVNVAYCLAGLAVAGVSAAVGRAILRR